MAKASATLGSQQLLVLQSPDACSLGPRPPHTCLSLHLALVMLQAICGLGMLQQTKETVLDRKKNVVHLYYHEPCAAYGGGMGAIPTTLMDVEDDVIREWQRGNVSLQPRLPQPSTPMHS